MNFQTGFMIPALGGCWIIWRRKQKKIVKLRRNLFRRNGGRLLESMLSVKKTLVIFTAEDLKRATNNYNETEILDGEHPFGITYKGILPDGENRLVTIRKCDALDGCDVEVFISKLVTLSGINHRNLVKMIGCCLETQVPLLVYEFIAVKTLYDYIHDDDLTRSLSWDIRLRVVAQTAEALAHMHNVTRLPVIHGNLNSSSILLNPHDYTVKVHDFAFSDIPFNVGSPGYLDPQYLYSTSRLTEKSDVYSLGVVLAELLTGKQVIDSSGPAGQEHIAKYFLSPPRGDNLSRILDHRMDTEGKIDQITRVAELAKRCLADSSANRPTMREVVITLELVMAMDSGRIRTQRVPSPNLDPAAAVMAGSDHGSSERCYNGQNGTRMLASVPLLWCLSRAEVLRRYNARSAILLFRRSNGCDGWNIDTIPGTEHSDQNGDENRDEIGMEKRDEVEDQLSSPRSILEAAAFGSESDNRRL